MKKTLLLLLPVLFACSCITIYQVGKPEASVQKTPMPGKDVLTKPSTESYDFIDPTDGLTYKWVKVRVTPYPYGVVSSRFLSDLAPTIPSTPILPAAKTPAATMRVTSTTGSFKDERDGQVYKTVTLGKQTWMAQNLNYVTPNGSFTYNDDQANRKIYGLYYTIFAIPEACPKGWHLPTDEEWQELEIAVGMDPVTAASKNWRGDVADNLIMGGAAKFDVLFGGLHRQGRFAELGEKAYFWTASKMGVPTINRIFQKNDVRIFREGMGSAFGLNVRCVKDAEAINKK